MTAESYRIFTESNVWSALWIELTLAGLALMMLGMRFLPASVGKWGPKLAIYGQLVLLVMAAKSTMLLPSGFAKPIFNGLLVQTSLSSMMSVFFILTSLLVSWLGGLYFRKHSDAPQLEFYHFVLLISAGFMLLVQSQHFLMLFVALESVTIGFYVLVAFARNSHFSLEAGIKYLVLGALSSSMLLFGIVLLYGAAGNAMLSFSQNDGMAYDQLAVFIQSNTGHPLVIAGVVLVLCGLAFKLGIVPFQIWVPDVYQGAPTPTTAFLAVGSKAAGFMILINLIKGPFAAMQDTLLIPVFSVAAAATIIFASLAALSQRNVKRVMGLSGLVHAGYILAALVAYMHDVTVALTAIVFYLFTYLFGSFAVFGVMSHVSGKRDEDQHYEDYEDLAERQPLLAGVLTIGLGSLAGVPPLMGFVGKFLLFIAIYQAGLYTLLAVMIVGVVLSMYYYFSWIRQSVFRVFRFEDPESSALSDAAKEEGDVLVDIDLRQRFVLTLIAVTVVVLGLFQGHFAQFIMNIL